MEASSGCGMEGVAMGGCEFEWGCEVGRVVG